ncbi:CGG triplet repeat-binding protein 1-like [Arctopsyche grandis]|uniref:CGG triplet repeat-binding protein 1-like n=1 Tax=Arctopsyche grandis TaxID=121162 RepID=UPI00406D678E
MIQWDTVYIPKISLSIFRRQRLTTREHDSQVNMGRRHIKIFDRAQSYKKEGFYITNDTENTVVLRCKHCDCNLEWKKKDNLEKHLKSVTHMKYSARASNSDFCHEIQPGVVNIQSIIRDNVTQFRLDTVKMCLKAGIPLEQLDHPAMREYFSKYIKGSEALPCAEKLIRLYVPICNEELEQEKIEQDIKVETDDYEEVECLE